MTKISKALNGNFQKIASSSASSKISQHSKAINGRERKIIINNNLRETQWKMHFNKVLRIA